MTIDDSSTVPVPVTSCRKRTPIELQASFRNRQCQKYRSKLGRNEPWKNGSDGDRYRGGRCGAGTAGCWLEQRYLLALCLQKTGPAGTGAAPASSYNPHYPDSAWLPLRQEEIVEPELEIVDPHYHLWDHPGNPFMLYQLLADVDSGHKITETVFIA